MENQETVMEKSWKNILSSLWELCFELAVYCPLFDLCVLHFHQIIDYTPGISLSDMAPMGLLASKSLCCNRQAFFVPHF